MKRHEHLFQFTGQQISEAARSEFSYHQGRRIFWQLALEDAKLLAEKAGVTLREYDVTGGKRVDMVIEPSLQSRLSECASKIQQHSAAADRFQIEAACYGTQPDRSYELQPDDVVYFRLAGGPRED